ncbi:MAG: dihydropteroate synthase [Burkholderiales bacterium]|nr:dihydropteroate synthase [Pseudomonadota bacterium]
MGVVNVTPDSFSDGGKFLSASAAIDHAHRLIEDGADILDIGGESTRPGAESVGVDEELRRVIPVIEAIGDHQVPISIDTMKPEVMQAAIQAGASMVNDVNALRADGALEACAKTEVGVCLMHMRGSPRTMQLDPTYIDVVAEVKVFLLKRAQLCQRAGVAAERIVIDPGFGFGKNREHNLTLLRHLNEFREMGYAVLAGLSRKSLLGKITGQEVVARMPASVAAAVLAVQNGAHIVRVHDVRATKDALAILHAVEPPST